MRALFYIYDFGFENENKSSNDGADGRGERNAKKKSKDGKNIIKTFSSSLVS